MRQSKPGVRSGQASVQGETFIGLLSLFNRVYLFSHLHAGPLLGESSSNLLFNSPKRGWGFSAVSELCMTSGKKNLPVMVLQRVKLNSLLFYCQVKKK